MMSKRRLLDRETLTQDLVTKEQHSDAMLTNKLLTYMSSEKITNSKQLVTSISALKCAS